MADIVESIEIAKSPEDVFAYLAQPARHGEWQEQIVSTVVETEGPMRVGSRVAQVRKTPGGKVKTSWEISEYDPPRKMSFRGTDGPVRANGTATVEPSGAGSRVTIELDLVGHGLGKLLRPLALSQARKQAPKDQAKLKERLESGTA